MKYFLEAYRIEKCILISINELWQKFDELELEWTPKLQLCQIIILNSDNEEDIKIAKSEERALFFERDMRSLLDSSLTDPCLSFDKEKINQVISRFANQSDQSS